MASEPGVSSLSLKTITVRVRRQNSEVETVALDEELMRFLQDNFPAWRREMITTGFTFDLRTLQGTEGFPEAAKKMVESQGGRLDRMTAQQRAEMTKLRGWTTGSYGMFAEYNITKMLEKVFSSEPCCLVNSFLENQLVNIAKEALDPGYSKKNNDSPLSPEAKTLWSVLCQQDIEEIQEKVFTWLGNIPAMEGMVKREDLSVAVEELLKMKKPEDILPSCFTKKTMEGFQKNLKQKKDQTFCKEMILRILLEFIKPNSEYDVFLAHKTYRRLFHLEVKTYPQFGEKIDKIRLKERYEHAKTQLGKGRAMFEKVIQQLVELPGWSHLGLICFTEIENREALKKYLPELTEEDLKFILTKEELEDPSNLWLHGLQTQQDPEEEDDSYSSLASLLLGSQYVSFRSQEVSSLQDKTYSRLVGGAELHSHLSSPLPDSVTFKDIKNKALGDISSILFWTEGQKQLIDSVNANESIVLLGDYGTGKTVVIQSVAEKLLKSGRDILYINALDWSDIYEKETHYKTWEDVLDVITKVRFGSGVSVLDIGTLRTKYRIQDPENEFSTMALISDYISNLSNAKNTVLICDELSMSIDDKKKICSGEESVLEKTLKTISEKCSMAWLVIAASSLLDEDGGEDIPTAREKLETLAKRSGYEAVSLKNVMRNTSSISSAFLPDVLRKYNALSDIALSISVGSCSTVSGIKPTLYLYQFTENTQDVDYAVIAICVQSYLETNKSRKTVILCDWKISPRKLKQILAGDVTLYDAGVDEFDYSSKPHHYGADLARQREDLQQWFEKGGVLLTHDLMYRGCEAESVVFLSEMWGGRCRQARSGPSRAVSQLCLVISDYCVASRDVIKQYFNLIDVDSSVSLYEHYQLVEYERHMAEAFLTFYDSVV